MDLSIQISETTKYEILFNFVNLHFCQSFTTFALAILKDMQIVAVKCAAERNFLEVTRQPCYYLNGGLMSVILNKIELWKRFYPCAVVTAIPKIRLLPLR